jgi:hypothetical protein
MPALPYIKIFGDLPDGFPRFLDRNLKISSTIFQTFANEILSGAEMPD